MTDSNTDWMTAIGSLGTFITLVITLIISEYRRPVAAPPPPPSQANVLPVNGPQVAVHGHQPNPPNPPNPPLGAPAGSQANVLPVNGPQLAVPGLNPPQLPSQPAVAPQVSAPGPAAASASAAFVPSGAPQPLAPQVPGPASVVPGPAAGPSIPAASSSVPSGVAQPTRSQDVPVPSVEIGYHIMTRSRSRSAALQDQSKPAKGRGPGRLRGG
ncbi:hypothetical protein VF21_06515 [Pseudogymnoascus sp. 05NY08]|nr:hypothetical protein VF21_06515 [Pseudogymnoascus sp. 05NY08]